MTNDDDNLPDLFDKIATTRNAERDAIMFISGLILVFVALFTYVCVTVLA